MKNLKKKENDKTKEEDKVKEGNEEKKNDTGRGEQMKNAAGKYGVAQIATDQ